MAEDGLEPTNVALAADYGTSVKLKVPLTALGRLTDVIANPVGEVEGRIQFGRERGLIVADVWVEASLQLRCQRCLGPLSQQVTGQSRVALVSSEAEVDAVPPEWETALAPSGRMRLAELLEEELLLALPAAPRHEADACGAAPVVSAADKRSAEPPVEKPFAGLAALMKGRDRMN